MIARTIAPLFLALSTLSAVAWSTPAHACSCMAQTLDEARLSASSVFEGVVLDIDTSAPDEGFGVGPVRVRLRVVQTWTPGVPEVVTVTTAANSAACGFAFEVGRGYLVFTDAGSADAPSVSLCGRTQARDDAGQDLAALGMGVVPVAPSERAPTASVEPARGGCAGCHVGRVQNATSAMTLGIMTLAWCVWRARRRVR